MVNRAPGETKPPERGMAKGTCATCGQAIWFYHVRKCDECLDKLGRDLRPAKELRGES